MKWMQFFLVVIIVVGSCHEGVAQAKAKKKRKGKKNDQTEYVAKTPSIVSGASTVVDYRDTFKLTRPWMPVKPVKEVKNAKLQDSVAITILLDGTIDGKRKTIGPNEDFGHLFRDGTLQHSEGWVNPGRDFSKVFVEAMDSTKAYHVEIQYKRLKTKLYGVLSFNKVYQQCEGDPSARSYFIRIPETYVMNALGGNISVVYEYYECAPRLGDKLVRDYTTKKAKYTSWVLWMSDISFVE